MRCTANVADRRGTPIATRAVTFVAEAGRLVLDGASAGPGKVFAVHEVAEPRPMDVDPVVFSWTPAVGTLFHTGELLAPAWMSPETWVEDPRTAPPFVPATLREPRRPDPLRVLVNETRRLNNPRDNLVTLVVEVEGEEAFVDTNANGTFDVDEAFQDLPEPFVDADDSGTHEGNEPFTDTNGNGQWDDVNGRWDAKTTIWASTRVLWTGLPHAEDARLVNTAVRGHRPTVTLPEPMTLECWADPCARAQPDESLLYVADPWFNALARLGPTDTCEVVDGGALPVVIDVDAKVGSRFLWQPGDVFKVTVSDVRDGGTREPRRTPPLAFAATVRCTFTSAPGAAPETVFEFPVTGTIE
jgi:hypothetical protein